MSLTCNIIYNFAGMNNELKIFAAPLQGFTESAWRVAHNEVFGGIDAYFTPFVRYEKSGLRNKDRREVMPENNDGIKLIPQIMASETEEMKPLVEFLASLGYKNIDMNMGCPFPLIANRGKGSGILAHPEKVAALLDCADTYSSKGIKFSVKMRLGHISADEWRMLLPLINDSCVSMVTLHPRIGKQQYKGDVDLKEFSAFYKECRKPLVYNGDLLSIADINRIADMYPGLYGVMIGRGLLADGSLAFNYKSGTEISQTDLYARTKQMHKIMFDKYSRTIEGGDAQLLQKMKSLWEYWLPGLDKKKKKAIHKANRLSVYLNEVETL